MFPNRAPVPPGSGSSYKLSIPDTCDRIKEEFSYIQQQTHNYHVEREKIIQERGEMQRLCIMYYEMAHGLNLEMHRQMEIAKRLNAILNQLIPYLSQEHQSQITTAIDRAKQVTMQELNSAMMHTEEAKCSKFFNGGNFGFPDQLEFYKQIASNPLLVQHMLSAAVNLNPSAALAASAAAAAGGGSSTSNATSSTSNTSISAAAIPPIISSVSGGSLTTSTALPTITSTSSNNPVSSGAPFPPPSLQNNINPSSQSVLSAASALPPSSSSNLPPSLTSSNSLINPPPPPSSSASSLASGAAAASFFANLMAANNPSSNSSNPPGPPPPPPMPNNLTNSNSIGGPGSNFPPNSASALAAAAAASGNPNAAAAANFFFNNAAGAGVPPNTINLASALLKHEADKHLNEEKHKNSNFSRPPSANDKIQNHNSEVYEKRRKLDIKSEHKDDEDHYEDKRCSTFNGNGKLKDHEWRHSDNLPISPRSVGSSTPGLNKKKINKNALDLSQGPGANSIDGYPTTCSAPATPATGSSIPITGRSEMNISKSKSHSGKSFMQSAKKHYNFVVKPNGSLEPRVVPIESLNTPAVSGGGGSGRTSPTSSAPVQYPQQLRHVASFNHGEVVCAVALHQHTVYSGGKGTLKLWDVNESVLRNSSNNTNSSSSSNSPSTGPPNMTTSRDPLASLSCLNSDSYIRSIKLINGVAAVIGGETNIIDIWDMAAGGSPVKKGEVKIEAPACYALTVSPDGKTCFSCFSDGNIAMIDIHNQTVINQFQAHAEGASCIEISSCGTYLWTGGLDSVVRAWDIRDCDRELKSLEFHAQIFSIGLTNNKDSRYVRPGYDWLAVGLENSDIDLVRVSPLEAGPRSSSSTPAALDNSNRCSPPLSSSSSSATQEHYRLQLHDNCVLSLRFAHLSDWFITTSKDHLINAITCPTGINILQTKEAGSVLTSDISADDKYVVTGSGDRKATLYDVIYQSMSD